MSSPTGRANPELPDIDDRLVAPGTNYEIDDGKLVRVSPSKEPHALRHSKVSALLEAHVTAEFDVASDMLTRLSETTDRAPDASVYPRARDPRTGGRQLEHLAFEVVSTESLAHAGKKAAQLCERGVRRVFAIDTERARALEWSTELGTWRPLDPASSIEDVVLAVPLPIEALVRSAKADDAMARALLAKRNPVLVAALDASRAEGRDEGRAEGRDEGRAKGREEGRAEGRDEGRAEGRDEGRAQATADAILRVLARRGLEVHPDQRERIAGERDLQRLAAWLDDAVTCASTYELLR